MSNVLLVEPKYGKTWGKNNQHVGLLRVGHWLQATGHDVRYVQHPALADFDNMNPPDEIYITSMFTYDWQAVQKAIEEYRFLYPHAKMHLGGIYATICPEHAEQLGADTIMVGRHPEARDYPPNPTLLPTRPNFAYLFTSYGCDRSCTYCAARVIHGGGIEQSPTDKVLSEIQYLYDLGFKTILFGDDNLLYKSESHIMPICEDIIKSDIRIKFEVPGGMSAIDLTEDAAVLMRRAGLEALNFGLESISADVRRKMGRAAHSAEENIIKAVELCESVGIHRSKIGVFFIIGLPYQTIEDMVGTLVFLLSLGIWAQPQRFTPIPNTVDWKRLGLEGWPLEDLHYQSFVAPNQQEFTHNDLRDIYYIARIFNMGSRMNHGQSWLRLESRAVDIFRKLLKEAL